MLININEIKNQFIMNYLLAKIKNLSFAYVKEILEKDKSFYRVQGIYIENIWQNVDVDNEIYYLARIENIDNTKDFIQKFQSATLLVNPNASVAEITYLSN